MNEHVYVPRIVVSGMTLQRQDDGNYTGNVRREFSSPGLPFMKLPNGEWDHRPEVVPWDVRVSQDWLRMFPGSWAPAKGVG